jgi:hypothetical protein
MFRNTSRTYFAFSGFLNKIGSVELSCQLATNNNAKSRETGLPETRFLAPEDFRVCPLTKRWNEIVVDSPHGMYQTIFEIGLKSFPWGGLSHPLPFVLAGLLLVRFARTRQVYQITGAVVALLASLIFILAAVRLVSDYVELHSVYRHGGSAVVEGVVENFHLAPVLGPSTESFSVSGVDFSYNALDLTPCFHDAPFRKGPIKTGLFVRITYRNGCIQRVEVRR